MINHYNLVEREGEGVCERERMSVRERVRYERGNKKEEETGTEI